MNLQQLDILLSVVAAGSFSAAARKLNKAQSAVSHAISELEIDFNLQLFDRSGRYPVLTQAGERIVAQARLVRRQMQQLSELATDLAGAVESRLCLAVDDEGQLPWLAPVLAELAQRFPALELQILFPLLEDLTRLLDSGDADLGICFQPQQAAAQFLRWPLQQLKFAAAVSVEHPLAQLSQVTVADLQQYRQLMVTGRGESAERQRGRVCSNVWWLEGDMAVLALLEQNLGWAWLPQSVLQVALADRKLIQLQLKDEPSLLPVQLELWQHQTKKLGPAGLWLRQRLLSLHQAGESGTA